MLKKDLRKLYIEKRNSLSKQEVQAFSNMIFTNFTESFKIQRDQKIHIFQSIEKFNEVDTQIFINCFYEKEVRVFVPKMNGENLISIEVKPETLMKKNSWCIEEPVSEIDSGVKDFNYVITPLLYCDAYGNRVGYGKGFYDRFFRNISPNAKKIGVGFFKPLESISDISPEDVPLDYLITPDEVLSFGSL